MGVFSTVKAVAASNPDGFTFDIRILRMVTSGISAAYKATQNSFGDDDLRKVIEHAEDHDGKVGGWLDRKTGRYYFDSIRIFRDLDEAMAFGKAQDQIAIFDLDSLTEIRLK